MAMVAQTQVFSMTKTESETMTSGKGNRISIV